MTVSQEALEEALNRLSGEGLDDLGGRQAREYVSRVRSFIADLMLQANGVRPDPTAENHESIGKVELKRPQKKEAVKKLLDSLIDGHQFPPIHVLVEWDDRWKGEDARCTCDPRDPSPLTDPAVCPVHGRRS